MKVFIVDKEDKDGVRKQLTEAKEEIEQVLSGETQKAEQNGPTGPPFGIVINGHSLVRKREGGNVRRE